MGGETERVVAIAGGEARVRVNLAHAIFVAAKRCVLLRADLQAAEFGGIAGCLGGERRTDRNAQIRQACQFLCGRHGLISRDSGTQREADCAGMATGGAGSATGGADPGAVLRPTPDDGIASGGPDACRRSKDCAIIGALSIEPKAVKDNDFFMAAGSFPPNQAARPHAI
jgi:hypothetical protein